MKRLFFFLLALMLGGSLAWAQQTVTIFGTVTVKGDTPLPNDLKLVAGRGGYETGTIVDLPSDMALNTPTNYSVQVSVYSNVAFALGTNEYAFFGDYYQGWFLLNDAGAEVNTVYFSVSGDNMQIDLVIGPAGFTSGGGDDTPKATLVGSLLSSPNNGISNATVTLTGADEFSKTTESHQMEWDDDAGKMLHGYYRFKDVPSGEYTISYVKEGYTTTSQTVTVDASASTIIELPTITMEAAAADYEFNGSIYYLDADNKTVYVEGAKITAYDGAGEDAAVLGTPVYTDANGRWTMTLNCKANATVYFYAEHPNIVVTQRQAGYAVYTSGNSVNIYCKEKTPDLLGMETYKVRQRGTMDEPLVEISWTWPKELIDNYMTAQGEGIYKISSIKINRPVTGKGTIAVGEIQPAGYELPATSFEDGHTSDRLTIGSTYNYSIEITYSKPFGNFNIPNDEHLTITLSSELALPDSVTLNLEVNNPEMGTVEGAGKYEKNDPVIIRAKANRGYQFKEWQKDGETYATEAEYRLILAENMTLTAVFEERSAVADSVTLTLNVNDDKMGKVEGDVSGKYPKGEEITLKAVANPGYIFKQWKSGGVVLSSKPEYTFVLNSDSVITAIFELKIEYRGVINYNAKQIAPQSVRLTWEWPQDVVDNYVKADGSGAYEVSRITIYRKASGEQYPTSVGFVTPEDYTVPATFFVDNSAEHPLATDSTYTYHFEVSYTKPQPKSIYVQDPEKLTVTIAGEVEEVEFFNLTLNVNDPAMGTVTGAGRYEKDEEVTIRATATLNYVFKAWVAGEDTIARTPAHRVKMVQDSTLTAIFAFALPAGDEDMVTITLNTNDEAMGTVTGAGEYAKGEQVTITATPNPGYVFEAWKEGNVVITTDSSYKFMAAENRTLTAVFAAEPVVVVPDSVTLTLVVDDKMGTVEGGGKYEKGQEVTIKAVAKQGYTFRAWMDGEDILATTAEYKLILNSDSTLTALFVEETANEELEQASWSVSVENQTIVLRSNAACQYDVYNMSGALVEHAKTQANEYRITVDNSGLYIIRRISATGYSVKKVVVR